MSTVTITPLTPGSTAASADYNATVTSWNTATANGAVNDSNIREEGIDRRTIADRAIDGQRSMTAAFKFVGTAASSAIATGAATLVSMNAGTEDAVVGPVTTVSGDKLLIRVSADFHTGTGGPNTGRGSATRFYLQRSDNTGSFAAPTDVTVTTYYYQTNTALLPIGAAVFPCRDTYQITYLHSAGAGIWKYRLMTFTTNETVTVDTCVMALHIDVV